MKRKSNASGDWRGAARVERSGPRRMDDASEIAALLRSAHTIAVVGLSNKRWRPSYGVSEYMQRAGYRIIPINPEIREALGEKSFTDVDAVPEPIDIVNIFRRSEFVPEIVEAAIRV